MDKTVDELITIYRKLNGSDSFKFSFTLRYMRQGTGCDSTDNADLPEEALEAAIEELQPEIIDRAKELVAEELDGRLDELMRKSETAKDIVLAEGVMDSEE
jgi:hypothetical protein